MITLMYHIYFQRKGEAMKHLSVLVLIICLIFPASAAISKTDNLVINGGFEKKKTDNIPEGWDIKQYRGTVAEYGFDGAEKHSGDYAFKISLKPPGGSFLLYPEVNIKNIKPGKTYKLSAWIKAKNLGYSPNFIAPAVRFNFRPERISPVPIIDLMYVMKGETGWKNLTLTATAPPNADEITLDFLLTNGTIWIDDVEITEVENP